MRLLFAGAFCGLLPILLSIGAGAQSATRQVAFTFDDLPSTHDRSLAAVEATTAALLRTLTEERVPAIGFVNEQKLFVWGDMERRTAALNAWLDAGLDLGNHTYSHVSIDQVPFQTYAADLIKGEVVTRQLLERRGLRLRYFRHPHLRTGPTVEYKGAVDRLLAERGYRVAPVTVDNNDFVFADVYWRARERNDRALMARVGEAYVPYMESVFAHFERLSRDVLGYELPQVLLLHANELNAEYLDDLIDMLRRRNYEFITLDTALKDPAYSSPDGIAPRGLSWLHRWMQARGLPLQMEPLEPMFVRSLFGR